MSLRENEQAVLMVETEKLSPQKRRWVVLWQTYLLPLGLYLLVAIVFTWPLALNLPGQVISSRGGDVWQHLWHTWWVKHSLLELGVLPFYTDLLYYPQRIGLLLDSLNVTTGLLSIPLQLVFGLVTSFNLIILLSLMLNGFAAYLLAAYLCGSYRAAFVGGIIYACCPLASVWLNLGQLDLLPNFWFPLFLLAFLKVLKKENWRWNMVGAVVCFVAMSLTSWYFTYFGLIFSGLAFLYYLWQARQTRLGLTWRGLGTLAIAGIILSPVLLNTFKATGGEQNLGYQSYFNLWLNSAALTDFVTPGNSALWGLFGSKNSAAYHGLFLGFTALGLGLVGLVTNFKRAWFWAFSGLIFLELALGPTLRLVFKNDALARPAEAENGLPTLNRLLYALPFGNVARIPLTNVIVVMLILAILAAFGVTRLLNVTRLRFQLIFPALASLLILLEFLPLPRQLVNTSYPKFYNQLAARPDDLAVLDLPDKSEAQAMYYQTVHQKPIVGGYTARAVAYPFALTPGIKELRSTYPSTRPRDIFDQALFDTTPAVLNYYNIQYVVFHKDAEDVSEIYKQGELEYIRSVFSQSRPYYQDERLIVWLVKELPGATSACGAKAVLPGRLGGWNEREVNNQDEVQRWMDGNAEVNFFNSSKQPVNLLIETEVQSWQQPRQLQVWQAGKLMQEQTIGLKRDRLNLKLILPPGPNRVQFKTVEPGVKVEKQTRALLFYSFKLNDASPPACP